MLENVAGRFHAAYQSGRSAGLRDAKKKRAPEDGADAVQFWRADAKHAANLALMMGYLYIFKVSAAFQPAQAT